MSLTKRRRVPGSSTRSIGRGALLVPGLSGRVAKPATFTTTMPCLASIGWGKGSRVVWASAGRANSIGRKRMRLFCHGRGNAIAGRRPYWKAEEITFCATTSASGLISSVHDAFRRVGIPAILNQVAPDAQWQESQTLPWGGIYRGPKGAAEFFRKLDVTMEKVAFEL